MGRTGPGRAAARFFGLGRAGPGPGKNFAIFPSLCKWNNYSVEVRQSEENPANVKFTLKQDETVVGEGEYPASGAYSSGDLETYAGSEWFEPATSYYVKNFIYQTFQ